MKEQNQEQLVPVTIHLPADVVAQLQAWAVEDGDLSIEAAIERSMVELVTDEQPRRSEKGGAK